MTEENTNLTGTLLISGIAPYKSTDNYPTHYAKYGKGGYRTVHDIIDLDNIPHERREEGMLVYVETDGNIYIYKNGSFQVLGFNGDNKIKAGSGITITEEEGFDIVNSNTSGTTIAPITCTQGSRIDGTGIWNNNIIPSGTTLQEILVKLLSEELYPDAATEPKISLTLGTTGTLGIKEIGSTVVIPSITIKAVDGHFNASSFSEPSQPTPEGVVYSNFEVNSQINNGFVDYTVVNRTDISSGFTENSTNATVSLGANKITINGSFDYTAPSNLPITNLNNPTYKISQEDTANKATWNDGEASKTITVTAEGVYPVFVNLNSDMTNRVTSVLNSDGVEQTTFKTLKLTNDKEITWEDPGELKDGINLIVDFPKYYIENGSQNERKLNANGILDKIYIYDNISGKFVVYDGSCEILNNSVIHTINGENYEYTRFQTKDGYFIGAGVTLKVVFNSTLNK